MVLKNTLEKKLKCLKEKEKEYAGLKGGFEIGFQATGVLSCILSVSTTAAFILYSQYSPQIAQEAFSLEKFAFQFFSGTAGGCGIMNLVFLSLTGLEYFDFKKIEKEKNNLRKEYNEMKEDYKFSRGYD